MLAAADEAAPDRTLALAPGGVSIRLRIAGEALAERLAPALAPLAVDASPPQLDIVAWEGALPPPPWEASAQGEHYAADDGVQVLQGPESLTVLDGGRAAFWVRDARSLPRWETAAPLRTLLRWALRGHGLHLVHAAAVVGVRGAALLAGTSGAGKSTTALAASDAGLGYVGDDYCAVDGDDPPRAHALNAVGKLDAGGLHRLPALRERMLAGGPTPEGKELVVPRGVVRSAPLVSIVLPRVAAAGGPLEPARSAEALSALATSLLLFPGSRQEDFAPLGALVRALPAHRLPLGPDPAAAAAVLADHLGGPP